MLQLGKLVMKTLAIVSTMIDTNLQSKVRTAKSTTKSSDILKNLILIQSMHIVFICDSNYMS